MAEKIKECPFCGASATDGEMSDVCVRRTTVGGTAHWNAAGGTHVYYVTCYCGGCGPVARGLDRAIQEWNEALRPEED